MTKKGKQPGREKEIAIECFKGKSFLWVMSKESMVKIAGKFRVQTSNEGSGESLYRYE